MTKTVCPRCAGKGFIESDKDIGALYRASRERADLSLREVARRVGFSPAYISDLELGKRHWNTKVRARYETALK